MSTFIQIPNKINQLTKRSKLYEIITYATIRSQIKDGSYTASYPEKQLAEELNVTERSIRNYIDELEKTGFFTITKKHGTGEYAHNVYKMFRKTYWHYLRSLVYYRQYMIISFALAKHRLRVSQTVLLCPLDIAYLCLFYPAIIGCTSILNSKSTAIVTVLFFCHLNAVGGFVCKPFPILIQGGDAYAVFVFITHDSHTRFAISASFHLRRR